MGSIRFLSLRALVLLPFLVQAASSVVNQTTCNGRSFSYTGLEGYGFVTSNFTDKYGDTVSIGSSIAVENWGKVNSTSYQSTFYGLPDRGWNTQGTTNYQPRLHIFSITFTPASSYPSPPNLHFDYQDTILFYDPSGNPTSGLDPTTTLSFDTFPDLPAAKYTGDGFGGDGDGGTRVSLDCEGLVLDTVSADGGFWISEEYGPFVYHFNKQGNMTVAIEPPKAVIPYRNGDPSYSSDSAPIYDPSLLPDPEEPDTGRENNQGFEGLTFDAAENALYTLLQSATVQDGGTKKYTNRYTRLLKYSLGSDGITPTLAGEWVVALPQYEEPTASAKKNPRTAAQSEIYSLGGDEFLILSHDSDRGRGGDEAQSLYRQIDVFSINNTTTNITGSYDKKTSSFAPDGVLDSSITPAEYCQFLDFNVDNQLARFGLLNSGNDTNATGLLNPKWESLALLPVIGDNGTEEDGELWILAASDNDFITQNGFYDFGKDSYKDASGLDLDSQALVFRVTLG